MICVIRAEDTRLISDGADGWINVPDIKFPPETVWGAYAIPGQAAFVVWFDKPDGERIHTLWHGPHTDMGPNDHTLYFVQAPKGVLQRLKNQLGDAAVVRLKAALRARRWLRVWCRNNGFSPIRNSTGGIVGVNAPLVIAGRSGIDLDDQDIEDADTLEDLE